MKKICQELKKEHKLVGFYCDRDDLQFCYHGYIIDVRGDYILFSRFTDDGIADGYMLKHICDILHIEVGGKYQERVKVLYHAHKQTHPSLEIERNKSLKKDVLKACEDMHLVASLNVVDDDDEYPIVGFISTLGSIVKVEELDQYGKYVCTSYVKRRWIESIEIEGIYEQNRHILYDNNRN
ncbi:MAG: hypothetical protein Q4D45_07610 [Lachnospiraceae bacterium]|nr:hypothetical protein [Lachnospiraceae bacterium]